MTWLVMNFILQRNYWLSVLSVGLNHFFKREIHIALSHLDCQNT